MKKLIFILFTLLLCENTFGLQVPIDEKLYDSLMGQYVYEKLNEKMVDGKYPVVAMSEYYHKKDIANNIPYFDEQKRKNYLIKIKDGKLYDYKDKIIDCERFLYAMNSDGEIYGCPDPDFYLLNSYLLGTIETLSVIHHSSFLAGGDAAASGCMRIENGIVRKTNNCSGHYKIPFGFCVHVLKELLKRKCIINQMYLHDFRTGYMRFKITIDPSTQKISIEDLNYRDRLKRSA